MRTGSIRTISTFTSSCSTDGDRRCSIACSSSAAWRTRMVGWPKRPETTDGPHRAHDDRLLEPGLRLRQRRAATVVDADAPPGPGRRGVCGSYGLCGPPARLTPALWFVGRSCFWTPPSPWPQVIALAPGSPDLAHGVWVVCALRRRGCCRREATRRLEARPSGAVDPFAGRAVLRGRGLCRARAPHARGVACVLNADRSHLVRRFEGFDLGGPGWPWLLIDLGVCARGRAVGPACRGEACEALRCRRVDLAPGRSRNLERLRRARAPWRATGP